MVNTNLITLYSKWLAITANLKTSSNQVSLITSYKVDTGSDFNLMPLQIYTKLFPRVTKEQLVANTNKNVQLKCTTKQQ